MRFTSAWVLLALLPLLAGCGLSGLSGSPKAAELSFHSFDGGGPEYTAVISDPEILACESARHYSKWNHKKLHGAGYTVTLTLTGLKPGETRLTVEVRSPVGENYDAIYPVTVDADLKVTLGEKTVIWPEREVPRPTAVLAVSIGKRVFYADLEDNSSAEALTEKLNSEMLELNLHDYGGFEKVGALPWTLPQNDAPITTEPGDIILYQGNQLSIYYDENTWELTRLARIGNTDREELLSAMGDGAVTVSFWLEWSE